MVGKEKLEGVLVGNLQACLDKLGFEPTDDQWKAFNTILQGKNTLILGKGGVGKSALVQLLVDFLGDKLLVGSTTGISNQRLLNGKGGSGSFHRIFSLPTVIHNETHKKKVSPFTNKVLGQNKELEYILIDEAGFLLNSDLLELTFSRINRFNKKTKNRPRRNIKLILVGDFLQLPVFFKKQEEDYMRENYGSPYFFKSYTFEKMNFSIVNMAQIMRTNNNTFKQALDVLRYNERDRLPRLCVWLNKVMYKPNVPKHLPVMTAWNAEAAKANDRALAINPYPLFTYNATTTGDFNADKNCPSGSSVTLKQEALVMTVVNDQHGDFQNGSIGKVTLLSQEGAYVLFEHSQKEVFVGFHTFEQTESVVVGETVLECGKVKQIMESEVSGTCSALPIILSYGLSVHKSQGADITTPCVVDLGRDGFNSYGSFGESLLYVALSRFSCPELVHLRYPITPRHVKVNPEILEWVLKLEGKI